MNESTSIADQPAVPTWIQLVGMVVFALLLRAIYVAVVTQQTGLELIDLLRAGDGKSYLAYAHFITGQADSITAYDSRVFPGLPMLLAGLMKCGLGDVAASLVVIVTSAAASVAAMALLFKDARLGWLAAAVPPIFLICSADLGNETPMLALGLIGLLLARNRSLAAVVLGGIALGLAGAVRPMAAFMVIALLAWLAWEKRWRDAAVVAGVSLAVIGLALGGVHFLFGDALEGVKVYAEDDRAYGGQMFTWPGKSLLQTPTEMAVPKSKLLYVWAHVAMVAAAVSMLTWRAFRRRETIVMISLVWLALNTLFLLTVGDRWGFQILPRLTLPALPATLFAFAPLYRRPGRRWFVAGLIGLAIASLAVGIVQGTRGADRVDAATSDS